MTTAAKVTRHRARLREQGLRPFQMWVPDTHAAEFVARVKRQARQLADDPAEQDVLAFTDDAASSTAGWR